MDSFNIRREVMEATRTSFRKGQKSVDIGSAMKEERKFYFKVSLIVYFLWFVFFEAIGQHASVLDARDLTSPIDRQIPLIPEFVWPYMLCYVFPLLPLFVVRDWHRFNRALLSIILANLSAFIVYLVIPVSFPRPELTGGISARLLSLIYGIDFDPGANKLPSLHVTFTWIVYLACRGQRLSRFGEMIIFFLAVMITLSALFVKQHIIIDVVVGIFWAFTAWTLGGYSYRLLTDPRSDARVGLKQMTGKVILAVFAFSVVVLSVILFG
jgi:membrane-associated phospholipid phosphatase